LKTAEIAPICLTKDIVLLKALNAPVIPIAGFTVQLMGIGLQAKRLGVTFHKQRPNHRLIMIQPQGQQIISCQAAAGMYVQFAPFENV
jgi:hypothetical protein